MSEERRTRLYGAIDLPEPTIDETGAIPAQTGVAIGEYLARYQISDVLGRGGMGEVLSAKDDQIGRAVAIKRLRVRDPKPEVLARFLREVRIQARLEHPAIVPVYELHAETEQPFFVMKQLAGTTLADVIDRLAKRDDKAEKQFTQQRLLRAFVDVCLAVEFAHTRAVVHRDLKPANVVLGDFGEVYVLDWGIARVASEGEERTQFADIDTLGETGFLGTPGYMSPEQISNVGDLDGRADVYSLGCMLFEILALESLHPRGQAALASTLASASIDPRPSQRALDRDVPPELDSICVRATLLDRDRRFPTARALGEAVQAFLDGNRDSALRSELARTELDAAMAALAQGSADNRRVAMRTAARALALDPTFTPAADLVGHLMLEPPKEVPAEVEAELEQIDMQAIRKSARFGNIAAIAYLAFFPILYWVGFRETWYLIAGPALAGIIVVANGFLVRRWPYWPRYVAIAANLVMFALFSLLITPFVFNVGPPIIMISLLAVQRRLIPISVVAVLAIAATLSPFAFEAAGVIGPIVSVAGSDLILHTFGGKLDATTTTIAVFVYVVALSQIASLLARLQDDDRREVRRTIQLQTWQLRELVPRAT